MARQPIFDCGPGLDLCAHLESSLTILSSGEVVAVSATAFFGFFLLVVVLAALGIGAFLLTARNNDRSQAREVFTADFGEQQQKAQLLDLHSQLLLRRSELWSQVVEGQTVQQLGDHAQRVQTSSGEAQQIVHSVGASTSAEMKALSSDQLQRVGHDLKTLRVVLEAWEQNLGALLQFGALIDHLLLAVPIDAALLHADVEAVEALVNESQTQDSAVIDSVAQLRELTDGLIARSSDQPSDVVTQRQQIERAEIQSLGVRHALETGLNAGQILDRRYAALDDAHEVQLLRIEEARRQFVELAEQHDSSSWRWAQDQLDNALGQLESASTILRLASVDAATASELAEASRALDAATKEILIADTMLTQIDDLLVDLSRARVESPGILEQSRQAIDNQNQLSKTQAFDQRFLAQQQSYLSATEHRLQADKPNFLEIASLGDRLNREVDEMFLATVRQVAPKEGESSEHGGESNPSENEEDPTAAAQLDRTQRQAHRENARAQRSLQRARAAIRWLAPSPDDEEVLQQLDQRLLNVPDDPSTKLATCKAVANTAIAIQERIIARRRRVMCGAPSPNENNLNSAWFGSIPVRSGGDSATGGSFGGGYSVHMSMQTLSNPTTL